MKERLPKKPSGDKDISQGLRVLLGGLKRRNEIDAIIDSTREVGLPDSPRDEIDQILDNGEDNGDDKPKW